MVPFGNTGSVSKCGLLLCSTLDLVYPVDIPCYPNNEIPPRFARRNDVKVVNVIPTGVEGSRLSCGSIVLFQQWDSPREVYSELVEGLVGMTL